MEIKPKEQQELSSQTPDTPAVKDNLNVIGQKHTVTKIDWEKIKDDHGKNRPETKYDAAGNRFIGLLPALTLGGVTGVAGLSTVGVALTAILVPPLALPFGILAIVFGISTFISLTATVGAVAFGCLRTIPKYPSQSEQLLNSNFSGIDMLKKNLMTFHEHGVDQEILEAIESQIPVFEEAKNKYNDFRNYYKGKINNLHREHNEGLSSIRLMIKEELAYQEKLKGGTTPGIDKEIEISKGAIKEYQQKSHALLEKIDKDTDLLKSELLAAEKDANSTEEACVESVKKVCEKVLEKTIKKQYDKEHPSIDYETFRQHKLQVYQARQTSILSLGLYYPLQAH